MCPICLKWPGLAKFCFYAACLETSLLGLKGTAQDYVSPGFLFFLASFVTLTLYCDSGAQLIFGLASFAINLFGILPIVYKVPLNMQNILVFSAFILAYAMIGLIFAVTIKHLEHNLVSHLERNMKETHE